MRGELERGTDCHTLTPSSSDHSSTSFTFWLGCSTVGHWGLKALRLELVLTLASCLQLTAVCVLVIFLFDAHLFPVGVRICHHHRIQPRPQVKGIFRYLWLDAPISLFFYLFTQVHLLIDGSVESQHVTLHWGVREGATPFPGLLRFTLDPYLIMQGSIKYHLLSFWYDSTCDWNLVSWTIGEHSIH